MIRVLPLLLLSPIIFIILLISRGKVEGLKYFSNLKNLETLLLDNNLLVLMKTGMESFLSFEYLVRIINDGVFYIESGIFRIIFMAIPRDIWPDKPELLSRIISKKYNIDAYESGGSAVATIYGDSFLNGHVVGVLIVMFIVGFVSKVIHASVFYNIKVNRESRSILIAFYSIFVYQFLFYFRGFFSESYWKLIILILVFTILFRMRKLFLKSR